MSKSSYRKCRTVVRPLPFYLHWNSYTIFKCLDRCSGYAMWNFKLNQRIHVITYTILSQDNWKPVFGRLMWCQLVLMYCSISPLCPKLFQHTKERKKMHTPTLRYCVDEISHCYLHLKKLRPKVWNNEWKFTAIKLTWNIFNASDNTPTFSGNEKITVVDSLSSPIFT